MDETQRMLLVLAGIFVLGTGTQWLAWRLRVPSILLLVVVGILSGSVTGLIDPEALFGKLLSPIVSLSVGLILFEGGLSLRFRDVRGHARSLIGLLTIGVAVTWVGATFFATTLLGMPIPVAMVLGAVLTVTGPTVIGPLLRDIRPTGKVGAIAKWEGIVVDPIGATLALLVFEGYDAIRQAEFGSATVAAIRGLAEVTAIGLLLGFTAAGVLMVMIKRFWIPDYLQNPMTLMFVVGTFAGAEWLHHEAGLLAVTVMGITLANQRTIPVQQMLEFKESLATLLIAGLFILLSARVPLESLTALGWRGPAFALAMILIVRPVSVWISTPFSRLTRAERGLLAWLAPRGIVAAAVSSVFALRLGEAGEAIAPATFTVIFMTVAIYGLTAGRVSQRLGLSRPDAQGLLIAGAGQVSRTIGKALAKEGFSVVLVDTRFPRIRKSRDLGLRACFANILSEHVLDEVDFGGLGRFLALTSNDQVNSMAIARFRELFGRDNVYRVARAEKRSTRMESDWERRMEGRTLFTGELTYEELDSALDRGATIKTTRLTDTFDAAAYRKLYGDRAVPLFVIDGKRLSVVTADAKPTFRAGQSVVSLVRPERAEVSAVGVPEPTVATVDETQTSGEATI